jgi:hypothetical protein
MSKFNWISVNDKLPKSKEGEFCDVLTYTKGNVIGVRSFIKGDWYKDGKIDSFNVVTHWMVLPKSPEKPTYEYI